MIPGLVTYGPDWQFLSYKAWAEAVGSLWSYYSNPDNYIESLEYYNRYW